MNKGITTTTDLFNKPYWAILILILCILIAPLGSLHSQTQIKVPDRPANCISQFADGSAIIREDKMDSPFFVVSDRDNNQLYKGANLTSDVIATISMNDVLYVLDVNQVNGFYRVAPKKNPKNKTALFDLNGSALDVPLVNGYTGYIPVSRVVKFYECQRQGIRSDIVNEQWLRKGFVAVASGHADQLTMYTNPDLQIGGEKGINASQYYFVYKENEAGTAFLVGLYDKLNINNSNFEGWIRRSIFTLWPNSMAYEPNWDTESNASILGLQRSNRKPYCFLTDNIPPPVITPAMYYIGAQPPPHTIPDLIDNHGRRMKNYLHRLYLLKYTTEGQKHIGKVTKPTFVNSLGDTIPVPDEDFAILKERCAEAIVDFKTVNVIFAVDGTRSTFDYWQSIIQGIRNALIVLRSNSDQQLNFRYSILIYRDSGDSSLYPFSNMKASLADLETFLNQQAIIYNSPQDEAGLFFGINSLFARNVNNQLFSEKMANYLFVIGDAGNRTHSLPSWDINESVIVDKLAKFQFNVIGIQINCPNNNPSHSNSAYLSFNQQIQSIAKSVTSKRNGNINIDHIWETVNNELKINSTHTEYGNSGIKYCSPGQTLSANDVSKLIQQKLESISTDGWKSEASNLSHRLWLDPRYHYDHIYKEDDFTNIARAAWVLKGTTLTQFVEKGYLLKQLPDLADPLFFDVTMLSLDNIMTLRIALDGLIPSGEIPEQFDDIRLNLHDSWQRVLCNILHLYSDDNAGKDQMDLLTLEQLSRILTGTPGPSSFAGLHLKDILDNKEMTDAKFLSYLGSFFITKYCIEMLLLSPRSNSLDGFFYNYSNLLKLFVNNATSEAPIDITPDQLDNVINQLPGCIRTYLNLDDTHFLSPNTPTGQLRYEWVDCRIFPNDEVFNKLKTDILSIIGPTGLPSHLTRSKIH
jgi:hypothetical protein